MLKGILVYSLRLLFVAVIGGALWFTGLILFTQLIPSTLPNSTKSTDGIVIFTGGKTRLKVALDLFQQQKAKYLLISGVNPTSSLSQTIAQMPFKSHITLGYDALDTAGNAEETAAWVHTHYIKSLRLITSNYHMPRSLFELRHLLPMVEIVPHPVMKNSFLNPKWWLDPPTLYLVVQEYNKLLFSLLRRPFERVQNFLISQEKV